MENDEFAGISSVNFLRRYNLRWPVVNQMGSMVCMSDTIASPVKMAELIEMPFGLWTPVGPRNHV